MLEVSGMAIRAKNDLPVIYPLLPCPSLRSCRWHEAARHRAMPLSTRLPVPQRVNAWACAQRVFAEGPDQRLPPPFPPPLPPPPLPELPPLPPLPPLPELPPALPPPPALAPPPWLPLLPAPWPPPALLLPLFPPFALLPAVAGRPVVVATVSPSALSARLAALTTAPRRRPRLLAIWPQPMPLSRSACTSLVARASCAVVGSVMPCWLRLARASCRVISCCRADTTGSTTVGTGSTTTVTWSQAAPAARPAMASTSGRRVFRVLMRCE